MISTIESLGPPIVSRYPYRSRFTTTNGWRMHYIDEGPRDAPPVLLLHGNPTWGYLWREALPALLAGGHRVVVPDQIGFGLSEKPHQPAAHSLDNHAANLVALLDTLDLGRDTATERFTWLEAGLAQLRLPATVIWGREDDVFTADTFAPRWHELWPHAEGTHLVTGRHFLQEDSGAEIGVILAEFAGRAVGGR